MNGGLLARASVALPVALLRGHAPPGPELGTETDHFRRSMGCGRGAGVFSSSTTPSCRPARPARRVRVSLPMAAPKAAAS